MRFPWIKDNNKPNYKVIELEAEVSKTKDDLIQALQARVHDLEVLVEHLKANGTQVASIIPMQMENLGGIEQPSIKNRRRITTISELKQELERRSLNAIGEGPDAKSAEDIIGN